MKATSADRHACLKESFLFPAAVSSVSPHFVSKRPLLIKASSCLSRSYCPFVSKVREAFKCVLKETGTIILQHSLACFLENGSRLGDEVYK
jgi:hypothetical protein